MAKELSEILEQYYQPQDEETLKRAFPQPGEYADIKAVLDHVSAVLGTRQSELSAYNLQIEVAARKNNLGIVNVMVVKRLALATVVEAMERLQAEISTRLQALTTHIESILQQMRDAYGYAKQDARRLLSHKESVDLSEASLIHLQTQNQDREGHSYFGEKLSQKVIEEQSHLLWQYDECEAAKGKLQEWFAQIQAYRNQILELGYPLEEDSVYKKLCELLEAELYGSTTLQLVRQRQDPQSHAVDANVPVLI